MWWEGWKERNGREWGKWGGWKWEGGREGVWKGETEGVGEVGWVEVGGGGRERRREWGVGGGRSGGRGGREGRKE